MKAIVNYSSDPRSVEIREVPIPSVSSNDVLIKVKAIGVCGSDIHQWKGKVSYPVNYPVILGHEFSGVIEKIGDSVLDWKVGDRVTCETAANVCGVCVYCRTGRYNHCPERKGFGALNNGAMAEYIAVRQQILHRIPDNLSYEEAALTEPACVAFNATVRNSTIVPGDTVVIIGPGPIGAMCLQTVKLQGACRSIVVGLLQDKNRMEQCKLLGADDLVYSERQNLEDFVRSVSDSYGADLIIDTVGNNITMKQAIACVRPNGQIVKIGWDAGPLQTTLDPIVAKGVTIQGTFSHTWDQWERVLRLASAKKIDLKNVGTKVPFQNWEEGFKAMENLEILKAVIVL